MILEYNDGLLFAHKEINDGIRIKEKIGRIEKYNYELDDPDEWQEDDLTQIVNFEIDIRRKLIWMS